MEDAKWARQVKTYNNEVNTLCSKDGKHACRRGEISKDLDEKKKKEARK